MKYSLFTLILPECDPLEAVKLIKAAGYDGVEWRCSEQPEILSPVPDCWKSNRATLDSKKWRSLASEYRKMTHDHGLEISNLASYCRADQRDQVHTAIEIAKALECPRFRICAPPYDGKTPFQEAFKRAREDYEQCADLCKKAGLQGLLELHMGNITPSASLGRRLLEGIDPTWIGIIHDPGNMVYEGYENWQMGCELLGRHLAFCHAKNSRPRVAGVTESGSVQWAYDSCEMNAGLVDWTAVFAAFHSVGYEGWVSNEDHSMNQGSSLERIQFGLRHLKHCEAVARKSYHGARISGD